jgi:hypothetical protein
MTFFLYSKYHTKLSTCHILNVNKNAFHMTAYIKSLVLYITKFNCNHNLSTMDWKITALKGEGSSIIMYCY